MAEKLNANDIKTLEILLQYDSASSMYAFLQIKGYKYATLAESVVTGGSVSGNASMNFLRLTARDAGKTINESRIYNAMARQYLSTLSAQLASQGYVDRDINHQEAWAFHNKVFSAAGLGPDAWTLNSVFKVMPSESTREAYWNEVLANTGNPMGEVQMAFRTETFMGTASVIGSPEMKAIADGWRARVDTLSTYKAAASGFGGAVQKRVDAFFNNLSQEVFGIPSSELPVIDLGALPPPTPTPSPAVTTTPTPPASLPPAPVVPKPPVKPRQRPRGKRRPQHGPTTGRGHPDSGHHGGGSGGGGGGGVLTIRN
jgi:hypothetical protein